MRGSKPDMSQILDKLQEQEAPRASDRPQAPVAGPIPRAELIADFKKAELLLDTHPDRTDKGLAIYRGKGSEIPNVLLELGRLREETFRTVNEGTGLERDMDRFDEYYDQFFAWDKSKSEITGAYRIGRLDEILKKYGPSGVYTNTLFHLETLLGTDFREGTLEAGRSFVRPEFQRGLSLLMIWSGLGRFIAANPQYKYLMGPVSISNAFKEDSKHLMVSYLMKNYQHEKSALVKAKNPPKFDTNLTPEEITAIVDSSLNLTELQDFVRHAEGNPRAQVPQLIKLYLELGVRFLAFHKDEDFNSVDGLIWLDITQVPADLLIRYFTELGFENYARFHKIK